MVAGAYAVSWAIQAMVDFDFHEVAWGVPILVVAVDALDRRDDRTLLIAAGCCSGCARTWARCW